MRIRNQARGGCRVAAFAFALALMPLSAGAAEPEFKPGIPGLKMVDVRDHKQLWREIDELQARESGDRISIAEYRRQAIEKTSRFLKLEGAAAERFTGGAAEEVARLREAFLHTRLPETESGVGADPFSADLAASVARLSALLGTEPRHQLFLPDGKKWLLRLAFSPRESKEKKEAEEARSAKPSPAP